MPIKKPQFINNEIYHIVIRATGDSLIFKDISDYYRGIFSLYEFNTTDPVEIRIQRQKRENNKISGEPFSDKRKLIVEILAFCFMPNHIHLLVKQLKNNGISEFIRKFGAGYVGYFNRKYQRKGPLFAKFRSVHIKTEDQLKIVFVYIHTNPVSLVEPSWKEKGIKNPRKIIKFLENYKWSSYSDYLGGKNFPSLTEREFILRIMNGPQGCKNFVDAWVKYKGDIKFFGDTALE